jgi:hypothetical protein
MHTCVCDDERVLRQMEGRGAWLEESGLIFGAVHPTFHTAAAHSTHTKHHMNGRQSKLKPQDRQREVVYAAAGYLLTNAKQ